MKALGMQFEELTSVEPTSPAALPHPGDVQVFSSPNVLGSHLTFALKTPIFVNSERNYLKYILESPNFCFNNSKQIDRDMSLYNNTVYLNKYHEITEAIM